MDDKRGARTGTWMGVVFVVLLFVGEVLGGETHPPANAPGDTIVSFFATNQTGQLVGSYVQAVALMLLLVFLASIGTILIAAGQRLLAVLELASSAVAVGIFLFYLGLTAAIAFGNPAEKDPQAVQVLYQARFLAETFFSFPVMLLVAATAIGSMHTQVFPRWYSWFSVAVAVAFLVGGADMAPSGFFAPDGDYGFILFWLLPLWVILTGVQFRRRADTVMLSERAKAPAET